MSSYILLKHRKQTNMGMAWPTTRFALTEWPIAHIAESICNQVPQSVTHKAYGFFCISQTFICKKKKLEWYDFVRFYAGGLAQNILSDFSIPCCFLTPPWNTCSRHSIDISNAIDLFDIRISVTSWTCAMNITPKDGCGRPSFNYCN